MPHGLGKEYSPYSWGTTHTYTYPISYLCHPLSPYCVESGHSILRAKNLASTIHTTRPLKINFRELFCVHLKTLSLIAGAHNPQWLIRLGGAALSLIKTDGSGNTVGLNSLSGLAHS